mgnify:CR=1 FL=1
MFARPNRPKRPARLKRAACALSLACLLAAAGPAMADDLLQALADICDRRGLQHRITETLRAAAAPSAISASASLRLRGTGSAPSFAATSANSSK